jgi:hypothetical protein
VVPADARAPVVMVFFDEFPMMSLLDSRGRIDRRLYPHFASFAQDATWYRNATGVSPFTPYAVPAMLTGRYPAKSLLLPTPSIPTTCSRCWPTPTRSGHGRP